MSAVVREPLMGFARSAGRAGGVYLDSVTVGDDGYVPPLLRLVFQTHRGYTVAILALRVVRSFIPLAVLWIGKLIIDGVIAAARVRASGGVLICAFFTRSL